MNRNLSDTKSLLEEVFNNPTIFHGVPNQSWLYFVSAQLHRHTVDSRGLAHKVESWHCSKYWLLQADILYFVFHLSQERVKIHKNGDNIFFFLHISVLEDSTRVNTLFMWLAFLWAEIYNLLYALCEVHKIRYFYH